MYNIEQEGMVFKIEKSPLTLYIVFMIYVW